MDKIEGYVIRHPGMEGVRGRDPLYIFSDDPDELKKKFWEGFNPVYELRRHYPKPPVKCSTCGHEREENREK